jgi:choline-glycine betaine transporter
MIDNDKANYAILLTLFHWGFHGWVPYALVGVQLGIMSYRHGLPLLMRTAFYPLLGKHTWGWIGDVIDGFTIVTVVSGICTSLGLGVWQITVGMAGLSWLPEDCDGDCYRDVYLAIIWGITCIATLSVLSGLGNGIKTLSQISLFAACFILGVTFFLGDTWFYMNSLTQCVGYYAQYSMTQLGWHVDAFAQQAWGSGGTPDMEGAPKAVTGGSFMDGWTIFYWGWWIAWCPFVGTFIARISRGRTVKEVIVYSLGGPLITSMLWFGIFGAMAIGMENNSQLLWQAGTDLYNDPSTFQTGQHGIPQAEFLGSYLGGAIDSRETTGGFGTSNGRCSGWAIPAKTNSSCVMDSVLGVYLNNGQACRPYCGDRFSVNHPQCIPQGAVEGVSKACGACFVQQPNFDRNGMTGCQIFEANPKNMGLPCPKYIKYWSANVAMSPVCLFTDWDQEASWYNTMAQFGPLLGYFFNVVSILSLLLFFVTSSDSGSLVVDTIAANGRDESSVIQRIFWAFTEGGLATGLVLGAEVGAEKSVLKALQAASICTGLPYTCLLCFLMPAIWLGFELETHMKRKTFKTPIFGGIFDLVDVVFSRGKCPVPVSQTKNFFLFLICPFIGAYQLTANKGRIYNYTVTLVSAGLFAAWIVLLAVSTPINGLWGMGWMMYLCLGFILANARREVRNDKGIYGNVAEDVAACVFMYPNAMVQAVEALEEPDSKDKGL